MRTLRKMEPDTLTGWWSERSPLEKIGAASLGALVAVGASLMVAPHWAAAVGGGALASGGAYLLKKGFGA